MTSGRDLPKKVATAHIDAGRFASIEWAVQKDGQPWLRGQVGQADPLSGAPLPDKAIYRIYSMTKPVTSAIAVMLVEEGRLRLYEPLAQYISTFSRPLVLDPDGGRRPARNPITIEHLLTHRSGLSYGFLFDCPVGALYRTSDLRQSVRPLADFAETIARFPLAFEPGREWRYSVATDIMARVIEVICGKPFNEVVAERVTGPLGLKDTGFFVPESARSRVMPMFGNGNLDTMMEYPDGPQKLTPTDVSTGYPADNPQFARGGYGLFSTLDEYMIVARFLATGKAPSGEILLSRKAVEVMWTNRIPPHQLPLRYGPYPSLGYGFSLAGRVLCDPANRIGLTSIGECGWAGAASTWFFIDPAEKLTGVVMSQYLGSKVPLADDMRNAIYASLE